MKRADTIAFSAGAIYQCHLLSEWELRVCYQSARDSSPSNLGEWTVADAYLPISLT